MKLYMELFLTFVKIGMFTFGGGFAMIPLIEKEVVTKKHWVESEEIINLLAVAQSSLGPIAINVSTILGYKVAKKRGALLATLGVVLPSFIIILLVAVLFAQIADNVIVNDVFDGINGAVIAMILLSGIKMIKSSVLDVLTLLLLVVTFVGIVFIDLNPIYFILLGAIVGLLRYFYIMKRGNNKWD